MGHVRGGGIEDTGDLALKIQDRRLLTLTQTGRCGPASLCRRAPLPPRCGRAVQWRQSGIARELSAEINLAYDSLDVISTTILPIRALEP